MNSFADVSKGWNGKIYSGGWIDSAGGMADVLEPATQQVLAQTGIGDAADIDRAAQQASDAQRAWAATPFDRRAHIIRKAAELLHARGPDIVTWIKRESGSITGKAEWEFNASYEQIHMAAALPMQPEGLLLPSSIPGRSNQWRNVPIGVIGVITPWNFPLLLALRSVAPALALGNTVILKPDTQTPICGGLLIAEIFEEAGLPPGVLHVVPGGPAAGEALVRHPLVGMISFTGSTAVGRAIGQTCGELLKKVTLELGGNNAMIVLDDADLDAASSNGAWGAFLHQGQICMQAGRHLVHRSVAAEYAEKLAARAAAMHVGDPHAGGVHLGPLINRKQCDRVHRIVQETLGAGARALTGATHEGLFYRPTVLVDLRPERAAFHEEIFGPVAPVTVFDDDEEVIALANSSAYGLSAAIHSRNIARADAIARRLKTGMVHINDQTVNNEFQVPFGGMGVSGNGGRFGGPASMHEFTQTQWVSTIATPIAYPF